MIIPIEKILDDKISDKKEIIAESTVPYVDTEEMDICDIFAISHIGRRLIRVLPAYYVDDTKKEIIVNDSMRGFKENYSNRITINSHPTINNVHEIDGYKFTMVTINTAEDRRSGHKYYSRDNWL